MSIHLPREQYDALDALNWSKLKLLEKSPAHFVSGYSDDSSGFRLGTAAHAATLEPELFASSFVVYPKRRYGKAWDEFEEQALAEGKQVLSQKEHDEAVAIARSVRAHPAASRYLSGGEAEVAMTWKLGEFSCKGRADYIGQSAIVDLKSTKDSSPREFARSCAKYGYFGQAAWYRDGLYLADGRLLPFVFVAVESSPPYVVTVFRVPERVLQAGREQYLALLGKLDYCRSQNFWGGYSEADEVDLELPWDSPTD